MYWRDRTVEIGLERPAARLLDVGTGTGKLLYSFLKKQHFLFPCGVDLCESMLVKAKNEITERNASFVCADSIVLPLRGESFDLIVSSFTLRSIPDLGAFFSELYRVLVPGGRIVMLELTRPRSWWLRAAYYPYLKAYLPFLGWLISGDRHAYRFLAESISAFGTPEELVRLMISKGFSCPGILKLSGGLATVFSAEKP